jgi:RimJ/RimL family protein N-acetyltransferase
MVHEPKYFLCTQRLGFRLWSLDDFDLAFGLWGDLEVTKLIDARGQLSENQVKERLAQEIETAGLHSVQYWPIFLLSNDDHVGCCGLRPYDGLFAGHNPKNEASRQLLEKLGFRYTHDEYYAPTGLNHPSYMMTAEEYVQLKNSD